MLLQLEVEAESEESYISPGEALRLCFLGEIYRKGGGGGDVGSGERSCVRSARANTQVC